MAAFAYAGTTTSLTIESVHHHHLIQVYHSICARLSTTYLGSMCLILVLAVSDYIHQTDLIRSSQDSAISYTPGSQYSVPIRAEVRYFAHLVQVSDSAGQLPVLALALLPLIAEAIALGLCLGLWLKLHVFMAIAGAIILAAVCPALTGAAMHEWQQCRLGTRKGASLSQQTSVLPLCSLCGAWLHRPWRQTWPANVKRLFGLTSLCPRKPCCCNLDVQIHG